MLGLADPPLSGDGLSQSQNDLRCLDERAKSASRRYVETTDAVVGNNRAKRFAVANIMERGRLVEAMADSQAYLHGKKYAIYGDPDFVYGMARFILETGGEPIHCLATNGSTAWAKDMQELFDSSPFGKDCKAWPGKDLWAMRSLS